MSKATLPPPPAHYVKGMDKYRDLAAKARAGDKTAFEDKAKAMADVRAIERESNRNGLVLSGGQVVGTAPTKRSMQEEYVRKFSDAPVMLNGKETTLREYHSKRLLGK